MVDKIIKKREFLGSIDHISVRRRIGWTLALHKSEMIYGLRPDRYNTQNQSQKSHINIHRDKDHEHHLTKLYQSNM